MSGKKETAGVIFTCLEVRQGRRWKYVCQAWGEAIATGLAKTQAEARARNREAKEKYLARLSEGNFVSTTAPDPRMETLTQTPTGIVRPHINRMDESRHGACL